MNRCLGLSLLVFLMLSVGLLSSSLIFEDITLTSGIDAAITAGSSERKTLLPEGFTGGVCLFDYDNDGLVDVYFVNGPEDLKEKSFRGNWLYRNLGEGQFEDVTRQAGLDQGGWGMGCSVADFDNDGYKDLYVTNYGDNRLYRNTGDGTFADVSSISGTDYSGWSAGSTWLDFNNDGYLDLYVVNYVHSSSVEDHREKRCPYLGFQVMCGPQGLIPEDDVLYRNNGDGTFSDVSIASGIRVSPQFGLGVIAFDYDNDGDIDLFVANDSTPNFLFQNQGQGQFIEVGFLKGVALSGDGAEQACMGVDAADYDGDGWMDIIVTNFSQDTNTVYRNHQSRFFQDVTFEAGHGNSYTPMGWGVNFIDYDNDGWLDIFVANGHLYPEIGTDGGGLDYLQRPFLYRNVKGSYTDVSAALNHGRFVSRGSAVGDLNNDGWIDLVVSNLDSSPKVLLNKRAGSSNWLILRLVGTKSNRDAIGARVVASTSDRNLVREVKSGSSYLSSSDIRLHFGFADKPVVDIEIRWPSGLIENLPRLATGQVLTVKEGHGAGNDRESQ